MGGHGKRSSPIASTGSDIDTDPMVNEAAAAAFQATMTANRLGNELRELISRKMMATAASRFSDMDTLDKKSFGYPGVRK